jgi:hypothetical protein
MGYQKQEELSEVDSRYPHHVDLVPPLAGFDESVEEEMIEFLGASALLICIAKSIAATCSFVIDLREWRMRKLSTPLRGGSLQGALSRGQLKAAPAYAKS